MPTITIPGPPIAKKRPRFARRGNFVATYNAQETEESRVLWEIKQQYQATPSDKPLEIKLQFRMPVPRSTSQKKRQQMIDWRIAHTKKPDLSNLVKFIEDVCNGVLWKDDSQIISLEAVKYYAEEPKTIITFKEKTWI